MASVITQFSGKGIVKDDFLALYADTYFCASWNVCNLAPVEQWQGVSFWPQLPGLEVSGKSMLSFVGGELNFPKLGSFLVGFGEGVSIFFGKPTSKAVLP